MHTKITDYIATCLLIPIIHAAYLHIYLHFLKAPSRMKLTVNNSSVMNLAVAKLSKERLDCS